MTRLEQFTLALAAAPEIVAIGRAFAPADNVDRPCWYTWRAMIERTVELWRAE